MRILAIDTALEACAAAVLDTAQGAVVAHESIAMTRGHAEALMPLIARVMDASGGGFDALDRIAVTVGPGSFTGLRVGIAAARAFAFARGVPVHPVVSHDAVAFGASERVLVVTDARRREVAWSLYDPDLVRLEGPTLRPRDAFAEIEARHPGIPVLDPPTVSAAALGLAAGLLLAAGRPLGPDQPLYLRAPDAVPSDAR
jgi:tRNA threonylcarbamoyl adenosine modification protein YeaZ